MRLTLMILVVGLLLTACVSESAATPSVILASDTPSPTLTYTPEPLSTPTSTPTLEPTATPTESPPPLPAGAVLVQKVGQVWTAFDSMGNEFALWLPDPDIPGMGWRQKYSKNNDGDVLSWNTNSSEWDKVPEPEGVVEGSMNLKDGILVWEVDVSLFQRPGQDEVVIGEYKDGEWGVSPFEILLPDEIISNIRRTPPYSYAEDTNLQQRESFVYFQYDNSALLGLKIERNDKAETEAYALVGGLKGIAKAKLDFFDLIMGEGQQHQNMIFIQDLDIVDMSKVITEFKRTSDTEMLREGKRCKAVISLTFMSVIRNADIRDGGCYVHPIQTFQSKCVQLLQRAGIYRPFSKEDLTSNIKGCWKSPVASDIGNWWEVAPQMPSDFINILDFIDY